MVIKFEDETHSARRRKSDRWDFAQSELIQEILGAAEQIAAAKHADGDAVVRTDLVWVLLETIERASYCCSLSDAARLLRISRQHAQRLARAAERAGAVELARNHDDRRIVQLLLTPRGRADLQYARRRARLWTARVLLGLDLPRMTTAMHVARVIRRRLAQTEREQKEARESPR